MANSIGTVFVALRPRFYLHFFVVLTVDNVGGAGLHLMRPATAVYRQTLQEEEDNQAGKVREKYSKKYHLAGQPPPEYHPGHEKPEVELPFNGEAVQPVGKSDVNTAGPDNDSSLKTHNPIDKIEILCEHLVQQLILCIQTGNNHVNVDSQLDRVVSAEATFIVVRLQNLLRNPAFRNIVNSFDWRWEEKIHVEGAPLSPPLTPQLTRDNVETMTYDTDPIPDQHVEKKHADTKDLSRVGNQVPEATNPIHLSDQPAEPHDVGHTQLSAPTLPSSQTSLVGVAPSTIPILMTPDDAVDPKDKSQQQLPTTDQSEGEPKQSETEKTPPLTNDSSGDGIGAENPVSGNKPPDEPLPPTCNKSEN